MVGVSIGPQLPLELRCVQGLLRIRISVDEMDQDAKAPLAYPHKH